MINSEIPIGELLRAPCRICNYSGKGFYQPLTHKKWCPFYQIGGLEERIQFIKHDWPHGVWKRGNDESY